MNKRKFLLIVPLSLIVILLLCAVSWKFSMNHFSDEWTPATIPEFKDIELYSYLDDHICQTSTLPEIMDAFDGMCRIPYDAYYDTYLLEAYSYEYEGERYFLLSLSYQFQPPWYYEIVEIGAEILYESDADLDQYEITRFFDSDFEAMLRYLRESDLYKDLIDRKFIDCGPFGMMW